MSPGSCRRVDRRRPRSRSAPRAGGAGSGQQDRRCARSCRNRRLPLRRLGAGVGRIAGSPKNGEQVPLLALIADCERGLGRPQRAIELARGSEAVELSGDAADELRIVAAGARADLGQLEQALTVLSTPQLDPGRTGSTAARLFYAYAEILLALGRGDEALQWFLRSAAADIDGVTDAEDRVDELGAREQK